MNDVVKEIGKDVNERLSDPLLGSFTISFLIVNWKFFFTLFFSDGSTSGRIYLALFEFHCIRGFLVPIVFAALYVLWRSYIPKALDIFKDYCEKRLDKWDLRSVKNALQLKNEIAILKKNIKMKYAFDHQLIEKNIEFLEIDPNKCERIEDLQACYLGYKYNNDYYKPITKYEGEKIDCFFYIISRIDRYYFLIYKSENDILQWFDNKHFEDTYNCETMINNSYDSHILKKYIEYNKEKNIIQWTGIR